MKLADKLEEILLLGDIPNFSVKEDAVNFIKQLDGYDFTEYKPEGTGNWANVYYDEMLIVYVDWRHTYINTALIRDNPYPDNLTNDNFSKLIRRLIKNLRKYEE